METQRGSRAGLHLRPQNFDFAWTTIVSGVFTAAAVLVVFYGLFESSLPGQGMHWPLLPGINGPVSPDNRSVLEASMIPQAHSWKNCRPF